MSATLNASVEDDGRVRIEVRGGVVYLSAEQSECLRRWLEQAAAERKTIKDR